MSWNRRRIVTIGVAAAVIAISVASLASGVSLRKLVKKEVAKQLAGQSGPQGAVGPQGTQGAQGPAGLTGPTFADFEGGSGNPIASPDLLGTGAGLQNSVTTPAAGRLLVAYTADPLDITCSSGTTVFVGLYVDGVAVPETNRDHVSAMAAAVSVIGVSGPVSAGTHSVAVGATCPGAPTVTFMGNPGNASIGAVLLGS